jgi:hypothetical protein
MLNIWCHQIYTAPSSKINRAKVEPNFLALRAVNWTHLQRLSAMIKKTWIAEISDQRLR